VTYTGKTSVSLALAALQPVLPVSLVCATHALQTQGSSDILAVSSLHRQMRSPDVFEDVSGVSRRVKHCFVLSCLGEGSESSAKAVVGAQVERSDQLIALVV